MLKLPHIQPLAAYVGELRRAGLGEIPDFDPMDGGIGASILFLFEKPGPMTSAEGSGIRSGSGFISRDNDDPTAEATFRFMRDARIPRESTLLWNVVPGWNGTRAITRAELGDGVTRVGDLIALLPQLRVVVLVGKKAARALPTMKSCGLAITVSDHPSPIVRARWPERWRMIPEVWRTAVEVE
jgi:hypothetical protein